MVLQVRAVFALVVFETFAQVVRGQVETLCAVLTWVGLAVINIQLTQLTRKASGTQALKSIDLILTSTAVQTRAARTLIHVLLTMLT